MFMNELVSFEADASRTQNYHDPTQKKLCHQSLLPTKKKENGIWAHI